MPLIIAGIVQDQEYFDRARRPEDRRRARHATSGRSRPTGRSELLGGALALLHLINFDEPFGFSVVEAMACGTPVIATARGSMPEIVEHGRTASSSTTPEEALAAVEAASAAGPSSACGARSSGVSAIDRMVDEYLEVYRRVDQSRGVGSGRRE